MRHTYRDDENRPGCNSHLRAAMEVLLEGKTPGGRATARAARSRGEGCREPGPGQIAADSVNAQRPLSIRELMATSPLVGSELRPEPYFWPLSRKSVLSSHWELVRLSLRSAKLTSGGNCVHLCQPNARFLAEGRCCQKRSVEACAIAF